jgi:photosystem II stability/assembly factor-like uncharacterized protein
VGSGGETIYDFGVSPSNAEFYLLAGSDGDVTLYHSTDGGASWTSTGKSGDFLQVEVNPSDSAEIVLASRQGAMEYSEDGGSSWDASSPPSRSKSTLHFAGSTLFSGSAFTDDFSTWDTLDELASGVDLTGPVYSDPTDSSVLYRNFQIKSATNVGEVPNFY